MGEYSSSSKSNSIPRLFTAFASFKNETVEAAAMMSPTSILDSKSFSGLKNPFSPELASPAAADAPKRSQYWENLDSPKIGLGLVDVLFSDQNKKSPPNSSTKLPADSRMVLFGSQLKIQIPSSLLSLPPSSPAAGSSPRSPADFGIKTRNSQLGSSFSSSGLSPSPVLKSTMFGSDNSGLDASPPPRVFTAGEMELSEDYTCVISHGPIPKTTHIFDDCIVDACCGVFSLDPSVKEASDDFYPSESFLSYCDNCRKDLGQGKDIYMYRGEKAFCSRECRYQEMLMEGDEMDREEIYGNCS
ncbi:unnamed protein product [Linum tenue]|uniref:FLZ-type domain-containing protein n=1 Tax=Linum tenue TaxID=586396 RepID=A0AAV0P519_9ROSI|nr:unnamed protein product [Linum tenue]